ncbi:MAG: hypothetical protein ACRERC_17045 [Candidatus Binatia bacterium]
MNAAAAGFARLGGVIPMGSLVHGGSLSNMPSIPGYMDAPSIDSFSPRYVPLQRDQPTIELDAARRPHSLAVQILAPPHAPLQNLRAVAQSLAVLEAHAANRFRLREAEVSIDFGQAFTLDRLRHEIQVRRAVAAPEFFLTGGMLLGGDRTLRVELEPSAKGARVRIGIGSGAWATCSVSDLSDLWSTPRWITYLREKVRFVTLPHATVLRNGSYASLAGAIRSHGVSCVVNTLRDRRHLLSILMPSRADRFADRALQSLFAQL